MLSLETLEVAIGIVFVYILISMICTAIREGIEAWLKTRAAYLEYGIRELLHDTIGAGLAKAFYTNPVIYSLFSDDYSPQTLSRRPGLLAKGNNLPSYIPSKNFALALMDIAARGPDTDPVSSNPNAPIISLDAIRTNVENLKNPAVQRLLLTMIDFAQGDLAKAQANIEAWYDSAMDRVSGWYKRSTQWIIFWIALAVAVGLNVDTIRIADYLFKNDAARAVIVARAQTAAGDKDFLTRNYEEIKKEVDAMSLPIGWSAGWGGSELGNKDESPKNKSEVTKNKLQSAGWWNGLFAPILGWLATAFAASLGAPFWFDMLNKVMVIRSTVKPHEKSPEEASEDRQVARPFAGSTNEAKLTQPGAGAAAAATSFKSRQSATAPRPRDADSGIDGCGIEVDAANATLDEELPAAEGGVARA
jgi:hypothetical protein